MKFLQLNNINNHTRKYCSQSHGFGFYKSILDFYNHQRFCFSKSSNDILNYNAQFNWKKYPPL